MALEVGAAGLCPAFFEVLPNVASAGTEASFARVLFLPVVVALRFASHAFMAKDVSTHDGPLVIDCG